MEFVKISLPVDYEIKVVHCKDCDCDEDDKQEQSLKENTAKATGG